MESISTERKTKETLEINSIIFRSGSDRQKGFHRVKQFITGRIRAQSFVFCFPVENTSGLLNFQFVYRTDPKCYKVLPWTAAFLLSILAFWLFGRLELLRPLKYGAIEASQTYLVVKRVHRFIPYNYQKEI